jgi:hypothetical protein
MYIQRQGRVPEAIANHFMQQLGIISSLTLLRFGWPAESDSIVFRSCWFANSPGQ